MLELTLFAEMPVLCHIFHFIHLVFAVL